MKLRILFLSAVATMMFFASCRTAEIAYIHDATRDSIMNITGTFSSGIQSNDLLYIYVESEEASAAIPFNQETNKVAVKDGAVLNTTNGATKVQGYLVNQDGVIVFPVLGELKVRGLTHHELAELIKDRLISEGHLKNPTVTVDEFQGQYSWRCYQARPVDCGWRAYHYFRGTEYGGRPDDIWSASKCYHHP